MNENPSPETHLRVKPLEWSAANEGFDHGRTHYGSGVFGHWYGVKRVKTGVWECFYHIGGKVEHLRHRASLDDAKHAAQTDYVARMLSALVPSTQTNVAAPHGWKLVPIEPTRMMEYAGHDAFVDASSIRYSGSDPHAEIWRAMLSAAPSPQTSEGQP